MVLETTTFPNDLRILAYTIQIIAKLQNLRIIGPFNRA